MTNNKTPEKTPEATVEKETDKGVTVTEGTTTTPPVEKKPKKKSFFSFGGKKDKKPKKKTVAKKAPAKVAKISYKEQPLKILKEEREKTAQVEARTKAERDEVEGKLSGLQKDLQPALVNYQAELDQKTAENLKVRQSTVDRLTSQTESTKTRIAELQKELKEQTAAQAGFAKQLKSEQGNLKKETGSAQKQNATLLKQKKKDLNSDIKQATKSKKDVFKRTKKELSTEKSNTRKRTIKATFNRVVSDIAAIPDVTVKMARAKWAAFKEIISVFGKASRKAKDAYKEPTKFSRIRAKDAPANPAKPAAAQPEKPASGNKAPKA